MKEIIKQIHESDTKVMIVEIGAGTPISTELFSVAGASNTIYSVESPYAREAFDEKYGQIEERAVSYQRLQEIFKYHELDGNKNYNTVIATTFQVGDKTNKVATHGWIGLKTKSDVRYYHISIHEPLNREEYIKRIGKIGVLILNGGYFNNSYIDIVLDGVDPLKDCYFEKSDFIPGFDYQSTLEFLSRNTEVDQMTVFKRDNTIDRLESVTRTDKEIVLFKGSFNPVSKAHQEVMQECKKLYPDSNQIFEISVNTFQKGKQEIESLVKRIQLINELGYDVIVNSRPLFKDTFDFIRNKFKGKLIFPMGLDTLNRVIMDYINNGEIHANDMICDFYNAQFICLNRNGNDKNNLLLKTNVEIVKYVEDFYHAISSTEIRKHLADGNFDKVKDIVPDVLHETIKNNWMNKS